MLTDAAEMGQGHGCSPGRPGAKVGSSAGDGDVGGGTRETVSTKDPGCT